MIKDFYKRQVFVKEIKMEIRQLIKFFLLDFCHFFPEKRGYIANEMRNLFLFIFEKVGSVGQWEAKLFILWSDKK